MYRLSVLLLSCFASFGLAWAAPNLSWRDEVPETLREWIPWVKSGMPQLECPKVTGSRQCAWPGAISFRIGERGGSFTALVEMFSEGDISLPGSSELPVHSLQIATEEGSVIEAPTFSLPNGLKVRLSKGRYKISGNFSWATPPSAFPIPSDFGLLHVEIEGSSTPPVISRDDREFRIVKEAQHTANDALTITVARHIYDGNPARMQTRIALRVSGGSRSVQLGKVLPDSAVPVAIETSLPYQLQPDGSLSIQLVPGEYVTDLYSYLAQPLTKLTLPKPTIESWPLEETFVFQPDSGFRAVEIQGLSPLSAELSQVPPGWKQGASYVAKKGAEIVFKEMSRGEQSTGPANVSLIRDLWIDLDGAGFTVKDRFSGQLTNSNRLNALSETQVGRASSNGAPILIASDPEKKLKGVEIRTNKLNIEAVSRIESERSISAVGWDQIVQNLSLSLSLPPSWKLIAVRGARYASGSWIDSWTLLDVFLSMLIAVAAYHLFGTSAACIIGALLIVNHEEFLAPRILLVHLMLLTVWKSVVQKSTGVWHRLASLLVFTTFAALALQAAAFIKLQVTQFLYPQLQAGTRYRTFLQELINVFEGNFLAWPFLLFLLGFVFISIRSIARGKTWLKRFGRLIGWGFAFVAVIFVSIGFIAGGGAIIGGSGAYRDSRNTYDREPAKGNYEAQPAPSSGRSSQSIRRGGAKEAADNTSNQMFSYEDKVFLAGPPLPQWNWRTHTIGVDAPLGPDHALKFVLLSPFFTRGLSLVRIGLLALLLGILFKRLGYTLPTRKFGSAVSIALFAISSWPSPAGAEVPSKEILNDLRNRIEQGECQSEVCSTILEGLFNVSQNSYELDLIVTSAGPSAIVLPGTLSTLLPASILVNGKYSTSVRRNSGNYLEVYVKDGKSKIEIQGELLEKSAFSLEFPQRPVFFKVTTDTWYVEGLSASGVPSESIRLTNRSAKTGQDNTLFNEAASSLPVWITASRSIFIGDQILVSTTLERSGDTAQAASVDAPLLKGEKVTTPGFRSDGTRVLGTIPNGSASVTYTSTISYSSLLELKAVTEKQFTENWSLSCAPIVNCTISGLTPSRTSTLDNREYSWKPFPDETAQVKIIPLAGIPGDFLTVDSVTHASNWGTSIQSGNLNIIARVTQQSSLSLQLPSGAVLDSALVDGQRGNTTSIAEKVNVLLNPGNHTVAIGYSLPWSPSFREYAPEVRFSTPVHNVIVQIAPSSDRWLLWTGGGLWGPAVVFWGKLFFIALICLGLTWFGLLPVSIPGAVFLSVGLSALPVIALAVPLGWLFALRILPDVSSKLRSIAPWLKISVFAGLTLLALASFYRIVQIGLVLAPPMLIAGNQSTANSLRWYLDHTDNTLPRPWVLSLSIGWWRVFALAWSTWLVIVMIRWVRRSAEVVRGML